MGEKEPQVQDTIHIPEVIITTDLLEEVMMNAGLKQQVQETIEDMVTLEEHIDIVINITLKRDGIIVTGIMKKLHVE